MENPGFGIELYKEAKRERYLTTAELQRLGAAIREAEIEGIPWEPDPDKSTKHAPKAENRRLRIDATAAAALRLFILTGARLREILHLTWDMVDLERGLLLLPDSKSGDRTIVLNAPAQMVLAELPRIDRYVIPGKPRRAAPGRSPESRPRADLKRPWQMVRKRAGLEASPENPRLRVRIHDLRHTFASIGVGSNLGLPIVGKLLGHAQSKTTERYAHLDADPLRKASNAIGNTIAAAMGEGQSRTSRFPCGPEGAAVTISLGGRNSPVVGPKPKWTRGGLGVSFEVMADERPTAEENRARVERSGSQFDRRLIATAQERSPGTTAPGKPVR